MRYCFRACSDRRRIGTLVSSIFTSLLPEVSEHVLIEEGLGLIYLQRKRLMLHSFRACSDRRRIGTEGFYDWSRV